VRTWSLVAHGGVLSSAKDMREQCLRKTDAVALVCTVRVLHVHLHRCVFLRGARSALRLMAGPSGRGRAPKSGRLKGWDDGNSNGGDESHGADGRDALRDEEKREERRREMEDAEQRRFEKEREVCAPAGGGWEVAIEMQGSRAGACGKLTNALEPDTVWCLACRCQCPPPSLALPHARKNLTHPNAWRAQRFVASSSGGAAAPGSGGTGIVPPIDSTPMGSHGRSTGAAVQRTLS
jgi:hypothetical protein